MLLGSVSGVRNQSLESVEFFLRQRLNLFLRELTHSKKLEEEKKGEKNLVLQRNEGSCLKCKFGSGKGEGSKEIGREVDLVLIWCKQSVFH